MSDGLVNAAVGGSWADVVGAAASVAGVTWQNVGGDIVLIAFGGSSEPSEATDAFHALKQYDAYFDVSGSDYVWVRSPGSSRVTASEA